MVELGTPMDAPGAGWKSGLEYRTRGCRKRMDDYSLSMKCAWDKQSFLLPKSLDDADVDNGLDGEKKVLELIKHRKQTASDRRAKCRHKRMC